jgi:hypothetical protein
MMNPFVFRAKKTTSVLIETAGFYKFFTSLTCAHHNPALSWQQHKKNMGTAQPEGMRGETTHHLFAPPQVRISNQVCFQGER